MKKPEETFSWITNGNKNGYNSYRSQAISDIILQTHFSTFFHKEQIRYIQTNSLQYCL